MRASVRPAVGLSDNAGDMLDLGERAPMAGDFALLSAVGGTSLGDGQPPAG